MAKVLSARDAIPHILANYKYIDDTKLTQYKLAKLLRVEPVMITHWKRGSSGMSEKLRKRFFEQFGIVIQPE